jgi:RNA exonuclease 4
MNTYYASNHRSDSLSSRSSSSWGGSSMEGSSNHSTANITVSDRSSESSSIHSSGSSEGSENSNFNYLHAYKKRQLPAHSDYVAMDCEMVGGISGESICARVVLIDWKGKEVLSTHVKPSQQVADLRTFVSGIQAIDLEDPSLPTLEEVRIQVWTLIQNKIVIGHALENDFSCLDIQHPWEMTRDTAFYEPFLKVDAYGNKWPRKLRELVQDKLGVSIQSLDKPHCPIEDAKAALDLYKQHRPRWEACMTREKRRCKQQHQQHRRHQKKHQQVYPMVAYPVQLVVANNGGEQPQYFLQGSSTWQTQTV